MSKDKIAKKKGEGLHPLVLLALIVLIAVVLTYIIPAGTYERAVNPDTGRTEVVPGTFTFVEQSPVGVGGFLLSFQRGIINAANIMGFLLLIGGGFGIINSTGAIEALMARFIVRFKSDVGQSVLIFGLLTFFALCASTFGMAMESLVFAPFLIALMIALGYDAVLGISIPVVGCAIGYGAAFINPFNIGIAQEIAEIPYLSGMWFRIVFFVIVVTVSGLYLISYARKIKKNPEKSLCYGNTYDFKEIKDPEKVTMSAKQKLVLLVFVGAIAFLIYGAMFMSFFMNECATVFLVMGVVAGAVYGYKPGEIAEHFVNGAKGMLLAALCVAFANSIIVVIESGQIIDTIIHFATLPLEALSPIISAGLMVVVQTFIDLLINSGSGQAVVTMPLMVPIADLLGINRQVAVLAFQIGDGFSNMFWLTSGTMMIAMGLAKIGYVTWLKFVSKLMAMLMVLGVAAVAVAQLINLGPA